MRRSSDPIVVPGAAEADVVLFAGGGGSSIAIEEALGKEPDAALNHWPLACSVHQVNFPRAETHCADVMDTDCRIVVPGRPVRLLWLSPDCRHFSPAKGSAPVSESIRALAWAAIPWARFRRPRVIMLENVEAFLTWGPVIARADGKMIPDPARKGETFARWKGRLEALGYVVEWRILSAADYGAPTIRKRLFLIARCDGRPIVWPAPSHAPRDQAERRGLPAYRSAASIIDWARPCPSIFLTPEEARALRVKRPLEEATLRRIAKGLFRYTIAAADPFIVPVTHRGDDRVHDINDPLRVVTTAHRGEFALLSPLVEEMRGRSDARGPGEPLSAVTGHAHHALIAPAMIRTDMSGAKFAGANSAEDPLRTMTSGGGLGVATAILTGCGGRLGETEPRDLRDAYPTMTAKNDSCLAMAFMEQANTGLVGHDARDAVSTIVAKGCTQRLVAAQLSQMRGSNQGAGAVEDPLYTLTAGGQHQALLEATLATDLPMAQPFGRDEGLRAFLVKYYGAATAQDLADPLGTVTSRSRFGLVMVKGVAFRIVDIGMRMLDPETELAAAMGVPKSYVLGFDANGVRVTKTAVTRMVGNMVSPPPAIALLRANFPETQPQKVAA
ncbi:MAG TPA: DNA cytosine methyltransferase [Caulobacteraceae bacterium]|jgi:DNA (cytosine-5)-methyltransferase 1|nr:DNA cytosine methyltransferase [Caulobacteraceae bacterium]